MSRRLKTKTGARPVRIAAGTVLLEGDLAVPKGSRSIVVFAHGSGSSRRSPRNRHVAQVLQNAGLSTLLLDLLTVSEEQADVLTGELRFDIKLLAGRVVGATRWLKSDSSIAGLRIGYFGASTGAAAALRAAAECPEMVGAVVSRGGRPDLAAEILPQVRAPTLLIVGGRDFHVVALTRDVLPIFQVEARMEIVPGATHLFEEPGALDKVAELARDWFLKYLDQRGRKIEG